MIKHSLSNQNMLIILSMIKHLSNQLEHVNNTFYLNIFIILFMINHRLSNQLEHINNTFYD